VTLPIVGIFTFMFRCKAGWAQEGDSTVINIHANFDSFMGVDADFDGTSG